MQVFKWSDNLKNRSFKLQRIVGAALCAVLLLSLVACGETGAGVSSDSDVVSDNDFTFTPIGTSTSATGSSANTSAHSTNVPSSTTTKSEGTTVNTQNTTSVSVAKGGEVAVTAENTTFFGRHYEDTRFKAWFFNWTLGGFQITFEGTAIDASFRVTVGLDNPNNHPYLGVIVDGKRVEDVKVSANGWVTLAKGLSDGKHTVRVVKLNESMLNSIGVEKFRLPNGGKMLAPPSLPQRRIEIIGDSITCGYGNVPPYDSPMLTSAIEDGLQTYGSFIQERFSADVRVESVSGGAVYRDYLGNVSALFSKFKQCDYYDLTPYDFSEWKPDLLIINLGTNDFDKGSTHDEFISGGKRWIDFLRQQYGKDVQIIWTYGVMNKQSDAYIQELVTYYKNQGDSKVAYVPLSLINNATEGVGSGGHPTVKTHRRIADTLIPEIARIMGW